MSVTWRVSFSSGCCSLEKHVEMRGIHWRVVVLLPRSIDWAGVQSNLLQCHRSEHAMRIVVSTRRSSHSAWERERTQSIDWFTDLLSCLVRGERVKR